MIYKGIAKREVYDDVEDTTEKQKERINQFTVGGDRQCGTRENCRTYDVFGAQGSEEDDGGKGQRSREDLCNPERLPGPLPGSRRRSHSWAIVK